MVFRKYLPSLPSWNKAPETNIDAPQLRVDLGMHLLYDGTKPRTGPLLVEGQEDNEPCPEPVEYVTTCPPYSYEASLLVYDN